MLVWLAALGLPSAALSARSTLYATTGELVLQYSIAGDGTLSPLNPASVDAPSSFDLAATPDGRSVYVAGGGSVQQFDANQRTGALKPKRPSSVGLCERGVVSSEVVVAPGGRSAYVGDGEAHGGADVCQYDVGRGTGELSLKTEQALPAGGFGVSIAVSPDGRSAYVIPIPAQEGRISRFDVNRRTGLLSRAESIELSGFPIEMVIAPDGASAYFAKVGAPTGGILQFSVDPSSGLLSPEDPELVPSPNEAGLFHVAITPDGGSVYASGGGELLQYSVQPGTGMLIPKSPVVAAAGDFGDIVIGPRGEAAYVASSAGISRFDIDPVTGALTLANTTATAATVDNIAIGTRHLRGR